jgi:hypothetical protein
MWDGGSTPKSESVLDADTDADVDAETDADTAAALDGAMMLFDRFDVDGDGELSHAEFVGALQWLCHDSLEHDRLAELWARMDPAGCPIPNVAAAPIPPFVSAAPGDSWLAAIAAGAAW